MPKVKIIPNKGIRSSRGAGLHLLDSNEKGFGTYIAKASVSLTGVNGAEIDTGIYIPANATLDKVAIKITGLSVDADNATLFDNSVISALKVGSTTWTLDSNVDLISGNVDDIVILCPAAGTPSSGNDVDALEVQTIDSDGGSLKLVELMSTTYTSSEDTLGSVEVLVQYTTVTF